MLGYISHSLHVCHRPDVFAVAERPKAFSFFVNKETGDWRQPGRRRGCGKHDPDRQLSTPDTAFPFITTDALFTPYSSADGLLRTSPVDTPRSCADYSQTSPADAACFWVPMQTIYCWLKLEESHPCSTADRLGHHRQHTLGDICHNYCVPRWPFHCETSPSADTSRQILCTRFPVWTSHRADGWYDR